jgi:DNA mismatch repair protein MSH5
LRENRLLTDLEGHADELQQLGIGIDVTLDLKSAKRDVRVRDECDPQLSELRRVYAELDKTMTDSARRLIRSLPAHSGISSLSVAYVPHQGFFTTLPIPAGERAALLPESFTLAFDTDTHLYCKNAEMAELDSTLGDIYADILRRELRIVVGLSDKILSFSYILTRIWESVGTVDCLCSLAVVAVEARYVRPVFTESPALLIVNGRHPLLERMADGFIANSTDVTDSPRVHVITGPNSSGKSVYLKQIGLIVFLAHIGSFVPADRAVIPLTDAIFTLFHGGDAHAQPFTSSFTAEIRRVAELLAKATSRSLVLADEFGKTSSSEDGAALCAAFVTHFARLGAESPVVFLATHFHEIIERNVIPQDAYVRCSMEVRVDEGGTREITFLYHVVRAGDAIAESFGLQCALRAGLDPAIVGRARIVANCCRTGTEIPPNEECIDPAMEEKSRAALTLFFAWDGASNPRALLGRIARILAADT